MKIKGLDSLMRKLNALGGDVPEALNRAVTITCLSAEATAKSKASSSSRSQALSSGGGSLSGSITREVNRTTNAIEGRVYSNAPHAGYVEFGTGPVGAANHAGISPNVAVSWSTGPWKFSKNSKKAGNIIPGGGWIYRDEATGKFYYTRGQPARPFLYPTAVEMKDQFKDITKAVLQISIRGLAK